MRRYKKLLVVLLSVFAFAGVGSAVVLLGVVAYRRRATQLTRKPRPQPVADKGEPRLIVQVGHSGAASSAAYSPDGRFIVSGGLQDRVAILWEAATGRELRRFIGHKNQINSVAFSPDGRFVMTGSGGGEFGEQEAEVKDYTIRLWDISDGTEVKKIEGHGGVVNSVAFSPDGRFILSGSDDKTARLWDAGSGGQVRSLSHSAPVKSVAYAPNGRYVLIGGGDWKAYGVDNCVNCFAELWDTNSWQVARSFVNQTRAVGAVSFSSDSRYALLSPITPFRDNEVDDSSGGVKLYVSEWDITTGSKVRDYPGFGQARFSPDSRFIVTAGAGSSNEGAQVWDANTGDKLHFIHGGYDMDNEAVAGVVRAIAVSPDSSNILIGSDTVKSSGNFIAEFGDKNMYIYSSDSGQRKSTLAGDIVKHSVTEVTFGVNPISESKNLLQIGPDVWDKTSGRKIPLQGVDESTRWFTPQTLSKDGSLMLSSITFEKVRIWSTDTGVVVNNFKSTGHAAWISPDNRFVLFESISALGFQLNLFDIRTGALKWEFQVEADNSMANVRYINQEQSFSIMSPDGRFVYAIAPRNFPEDGDSYEDYVEPGEPVGRYELLFIETQSGAVAKRIPLPGEDSSQRIRVSPNGRYLVFDESVFDIKSESFVNNQKLVNELSFNFEANKTRYSHDGSKSLKTYISLEDGNVAKLFDVAKGKELYRFEHYDYVTSAAFSADGRFVITSSEDGSSRVWSMADGKELCRLTSFKNGDWIVTMPDGRFDTSNLEQAEGLHWVMPSEPMRPLPVEIFMRQYYEPRLLARVLAGEQFKPLPSLAELNRTQPEVKVTDVRPDSSDTVQVLVEVANTGSAGQKDTSGKPLDSGVFDLRLFRDGQLVGYAPKQERKAKESSWWSSWLEPTEPAGNEGEVLLDEHGKAKLTFPNIKLPRTGVEQVEFSAYAFNYDRVKSATDRRTYKIATRLDPFKGRAYVISLGVNAYERDGLNLRFAANDARQTQLDVVGRLSKQGLYEDAVGVSLISDYAVTLPDGRAVAAQDATTQQVRAGQKRVTENNATKAHLRAVLDVLAGRQADAALLKQIPNADKLRPARPEDLIIITASSHGYTDSDGVFYIVPFDTGAAQLNSKEFRLRCVSSDELSLWLRDVDAGELVMIVDACHSSAAIEGSDFKPGPMGSRGLGQLSYDKGMRILTATQADNVALEANRVRQGLLMYALLQDGLDAWQADHKPKDKSIELSEWLSYGVLRVPRLHDEVKSGRAQTSKGSATIIRETVDASEPTEDKAQDKTQQPSLFDFSRRQREVIIARNR